MTQVLSGDELAQHSWAQFVTNLKQLCLAAEKFLPEYQQFRTANQQEDFHLKVFAGVKMVSNQAMMELVGIDHCCGDSVENSHLVPLDYLWTPWKIRCLEKWNCNQLQQTS